MKQGVIVTLGVIGGILSAIGYVLWFAILPTMGLMWWAGWLK